MREFRGVDQQVCKHLGQPSRIAVNDHGVRRSYESQMVAMRGDNGLGRFHCSPDGGFELEQSALERDLSILRSGQVE